MRNRLTEAYAVCSSKCDAEICVTLLHGVSSGGVMLFQFLPPSRVIQIRPSSVPAQIVFTFLNEGASAVDHAALLRRPCVRTSMRAHAGGHARMCSRVRSGLIVCQVLPPSVVLNSTFAA